METPEQEAEWLAAKKAEAKHLMTQAAAAGTAAQADQQQRQRSAPKIVGGVEVGAQRLVGSTPELTIKASNIVAMVNKEDPASTGKVIAVLANSDGRYTRSMDEAEMHKLGLKGTKEQVEKYIEEVREEAGEGVAWRLEIVRVEGGLLVRGVVGESGEGAQGAESKGEGKKGKVEGKRKEKEEGKGRVDEVKHNGKKEDNPAAPIGDDGGEEGDSGMGSQEEFL